MTEILASKSPVLIQLVAMFFIAWEISGFSDKNIYRDFNKIRIKIVIGEQYLYDTKNNEQLGCNGQKVSLLRIMNSYRWLTPIRLLSHIIFWASLGVIFLSQIVFAFNNNINISHIVYYSWVALFALDILLVFIRGWSKLCYILHVLHPDYEKVGTSRIILYLYMFGK